MAADEREKLTILRNAVRQERQKNTSLENTIKQRDVDLRTAVEENDMLAFNNQRLTKRVEQLIAELDELTKKSAQGASWFAGFSSTKAELEESKVAVDEMQKDLSLKIQENEELHMQMFDVKQLHNSTLAVLENKLSEVKKTLNKTQTEMAEAIHTRDSALQRITEERNQLKETADQLSAQCNSLVNEGNETKRRMTSTNTHLMSELTGLRSVYHAKIAFDDTASPALNERNIQIHDSRSKAVFTNVIESVLEYMGHLRTAFSHDHIPHFFMLGALQVKPSQTQVTLLSMVKRDVIPPCRASLDLMADGLNRWAASVHCTPSTQAELDEHVAASLHMATCTQRVARQFMKLASYQKQSLDCESLRQKQKASEGLDLDPNCEGTLSSWKGAGDVLKVLINAWERCESYAKLAVQVSDSSVAHRDNSEHILNNLHGSFSSVSSCMAELCQLSTSVPRDTTRLVTQSTLESGAGNSLADADRQCHAAFEKAVSWFGKICTSLEHYVELKLSTPPFPCHGVERRRGWLLSPATTALEVRGRNYIKNIGKRQTLEHVMFSEALQLRKENAEYASKMFELELRCERLSDEVATHKSENGARSPKVRSNRGPGSGNGEAGVETPGNGNGVDSEVSTPTTDGGDFDPAVALALLAQAREEEHLEVGRAKRIVTELKKLTSQNRLLQLQLKDANGRRETECGDLRNSLEQLQHQSRGTPCSATPGTIKNVYMREQPSNRGKHFYSLRVTDRTGQPLDNLITPSELDRETMIKKHYESKLAMFTSQVQAADAKALELTMDCEKLMEEYNACEDERARDALSLKHSNETIVKQKDEIERTSTNYEEQLQILTEHICSVGEQNSELEIQLAGIKSHKVLCGRCSTWNTVSWLLSSDGAQGRKCMGGDHPSSYNFG